MTPVSFVNLMNTYSLQDFVHFILRERLVVVILIPLITQFFWDSEEGLLPRKKIRIRWYNDNYNTTKEVKIASIEGRYKYIDNSFNYDSTNDIIKARIFDTDYGFLFPSLIVTYNRKYYEYYGLRFTFDSNISYSKPNNNNLFFQKIIFV